MEVGIIGSIVIGIAAGFLAGIATKGRGFGILVNLLVGLVGSLLGGLIFGSLGLWSANLAGYLIMSVVGSIVFLWILSLFHTKSRD